MQKNSEELRLTCIKEVIQRILKIQTAWILVTDNPFYTPWPTAGTIKSWYSSGRKFMQKNSEELRLTCIKEVIIRVLHRAEYNKLEQSEVKVSTSVEVCLAKCKMIAGMQR